MATTSKYEVKSSTIVGLYPTTHNLVKNYGTRNNVEVCSSNKSVKYLFKYVYKGHEAARVILEQTGDSTLTWDEIMCFLNIRYVSASEALWRLFEKRMHAKSYVVIRLPVQLKNMQPGYVRRDT